MKDVGFAEGYDGRNPTRENGTIGKIQGAELGLIRPRSVWGSDDRLRLVEATVALIALSVNTRSLVFAASPRASSTKACVTLPRSTSVIPGHGFARAAPDKNSSPIS
jgi:hypothetical protein